MRHSNTYRIVFTVTLYILSQLSFRANAQTFNMSSSLGTVTNACGGIFYDSNGPSTNYANNEASVATFCAPPGQYISFEFTQFDTEDFWDELIIYNGPSTASPIIGFYSGTTSPGTITSSLGGCITFDFASDGGVRRPGWTANITCSSAPPSTGNICDGANPFCTGTVYNFPNNTGVPDLGTINCLFTSPNPVWYYLQIQNPGNLTIDIAQEDLFGLGIDVDFNLWGPFTTLSDGCSQISAGTAPNVDCSYSSSPTEQAVILNAQAGEFYILLLTNFSDDPGFISFTNAPGSTATTNCAILCNITDVTAIPSACNSSTNTYDLNGQVTIFNPPATGTLTLTSSCGGSAVINAPFPAAINYSIPGIVPTGSACNVTAAFSDDPTCTYTQSFTSPNPCVSNTLNCPQYASVSTSPNVACGGQVYYLEVANTACNGTITFNVVGNWGSSFADEISWNVVSNQSGAIVASGVGNIGLNGQNFNVLVGPLNPAVTGTIFTFNVFDSFGDGFNGTGGTISVQQPLGTSIVGPITGNFGTGNTTQFGANISISPATITINTPTGPIVSSVNNCKNFKIPLTLQNTNYCNTININLPWSIVCQSTGAVISSGTQNVTVYPAIPQNLSDVVDIDFNETTCDWSITPLAGCQLSNIGTVFNISPNPLTLDPSGSCSGGLENFELQYIGLPASPNCCSTGGPLQPISYVQTFSGSSVIQSTSPFWANSNHAALITIPPNNSGGNATSLNLSVSVNNYCFNPPSTNTATDYWITIIVDGQIVYDQVTINPAPVNNTININLATIASGYDETSLIQVYVYPNSYQAGGTNTVFNPNLTCPIGPDGRWRADISASIDVSFAEQGPTAASCVYQTAIPYQCCNPVTVSNSSVTVCKNGSIAAALSAWGSAVDAANDACIVFSSVLPVAGSVVPDNLIPTSTITGSQSLGAYYYCDTDNNGSVNAGDTYTLVSTFTATVIDPPVAGISNSTTLCAGGSPVNLFSILGGTPASNGTWTGPSALSGGNLGTFNPATNVAGTYTYTVLGTSPCPNAVATVIVSISSNPNATISYNGSPFCTNTVGTFSPTISGAGGGSFSSSPSGLGINPTTGVITPASSSSGTYTVTYSIAASGGCAAFNTNTTVVINPVPDASTPLGSYSICSGPTLATASSFTINLNSSFAGTAFSWSGTDGSSGSTSPISYPVPNNTCSDQTITYTITPTLNGCVGAPINRVLTIRPKPTSNFTISPNPVCSDQTATVTYTGVSCPGSTYNWTWPAGVSVISGSGSGPFVISFAASGLYPIKLSVIGPSALGSCTSTQTTVNLTVDQATIPSFNSIGPFCSGASIPALPTTSTNGITGTWNPAINNTATTTYTFTPNAGQCATTAQVTINITPQANAGTGTTLNLCSSAAPINLFNSLGGTPQTTGVWTGPSSLGNGYLGTFDPATQLAGTYTYIVTGTNPCPNSVSTLTINLSANPSASFLFPGAPFCINQAGSISPVLNGTAGGTYSASPAGLSITPSGAITPSSSAPGTYTVVYSILANGSCPAFVTQNTVTIIAPPGAPTLTPNPICAGSSITLTGGNAPWYEFTINGVQVQAPSANNSLIAPTLSAGDQVCVIGHPMPPFAFNGQITESEWGSPLAISTGGPASGFGAGNNLDAIYLKNTSGYLFGALAGQTQNNSNNRLLLFIDCEVGGYNSLAGWINRSNAPYYSVENLSSSIQFDAGFEPDYILAMNQASATGYFDLYRMSSNVNTFIGQTGVNPMLGYQNNGGQGIFNAGYEFAIPLSNLNNPTGSIKVFAMMVNDPGAGPPTFISNQFLTPAGAGESNYGNGAINFGLAQPNPISYSLAAACTSQTCITVSPTPVASAAANPPLCSGQNTSITLNSTLGGTTFTWTANPTGVTGASNGNGTTVNQTLTTTTGGTVNYTITPSSGGCQGTPINTSVTVSPTPTLTPIFHE